MGLREQIANIIGIVILAAWLVLSYWLWISRADNELLWSRSTFVFGSVEAIAFAAAGYYFGKEVNRERADNAEARDQRHETEANTARQAATTAMDRKQNLVDDLTALYNKYSAPSMGFDLLGRVPSTDALVPTLQQADSRDVGGVLKAPELLRDLDAIIKRANTP